MKSRKLHKISFKLYQDEGKTIDCHTGHIKSWKFFTSRRRIFIEKSSHFRNAIFLHQRNNCNNFSSPLLLLLPLHTKCKVHLCCHSATRNVNMSVSSVVRHGLRRRLNVQSSILVNATCSASGNFLES